jgi:hypothetical protein
MIRFRVLSSSVYTTIVIFVLIRIVFPSMGYYYFSACRSVIASVVLSNVFSAYPVNSPAILWPKLTFSTTIGGPHTQNLLVQAT